MPPPKFDHGIYRKHTLSSSHNHHRFHVNLLQSSAVADREVTQCDRRVGPRLRVQCRPSLA